MAKQNPSVRCSPGSSFSQFRRCGSLRVFHHELAALSATSIFHHVLQFSGRICGSVMALDIQLANDFQPALPSRRLLPSHRHRSWWCPESPVVGARSGVASSGLFALAVAAGPNSLLFSRGIPAKAPAVSQLEPAPRVRWTPEGNNCERRLFAVKHFVNSGHVVCGEMLGPANMRGGLVVQGLSPFRRSRRTIGWTTSSTVVGFARGNERADVFARR